MTDKLYNCTECGEQFLGDENSFLCPECDKMAFEIYERAIEECEIEK